MTIHIVVAVHDTAMDAFMRPIYTPTIGAAIRSFSDEINRASEDNPMYKHAEDYNLFELGTYDDNSGKHQSLEQPKQLAIGKQLRLSQ